MPPQASAAGHRVATRVRWVAMITTMHPASVAHPHAIGVPLLLLAHRGTPFTWTEACHPDQQATRPFAAPYAARAGAPWILSVAYQGSPSCERGSVVVRTATVMPRTAPATDSWNRCFLCLRRPRTRSAGSSRAVDADRSARIRPVWARRCPVDQPQYRWYRSTVGRGNDDGPKVGAGPSHGRLGNAHPVQQIASEAFLKRGVPGDTGMLRAQMRQRPGAQPAVAERFVEDDIGDHALGALFAREGEGLGEPGQGPAEGREDPCPDR